MRLPLIQTERCTLRPWTREDVDARHALWAAPEVRRYLWDDAIISREAVEQIVDSHLVTAERHGIGYWTISLPALAGFCGFRFIDDGPDIELMYGLRGEYRGQGFATEACLAAIEYLWRSTGFPRLYARTDPPNERSVRVMHRLGMTHEPVGPSLITCVLPRP